MSIAATAAAISSRPSNGSSAGYYSGQTDPRELTSEEYTRSLLPAPPWYAVAKVAMAVAMVAAVVWVVL